jgi:hypothetical protein
MVESCHGMTLPLDIMIIVEPRHGVAHNTHNIFIYILLEDEYALYWEITPLGGWGQKGSATFSDFI